MSRSNGQVGAAAVEFALVSLLLFPLLFGIFYFGLMLNMQISLTGAAREGARVMAITNDWGQAETATIAAAPSVTDPLPSVTRTPSTCSVGNDITVTASRPVEYHIPLFGPVTITLQGQGVMRCGG